MFQNQTLQQFLDGLASKAPTPGGGSAAAIMGAMGAALVGMVCNLTLGKAQYAAVDAEMQALLDEAEALRARLAGMVQADVEAFDRVMAAYRLPKDNEADKQARSAAIQDALKAATDVPLECARACGDVVRLSRVAAEKGNVNAVSDAGVAVVAGFAALRSAALNVYVNTGSIRDEAFVASRLAALDGIVRAAETEQASIYELVRGRL
jgi:formiminotetrahydrofolate cyclodeaminase